MFDTALGLRPHAISLSFGAPEVYIEKAKMAGIHVLYQAQTVDLARRAAFAGADAVVAQGTEAGGHTGRVSTLPLVAAIVDAVAPVPVIAAGGIADGRGIAAMLVLGAEGVWLGTRFVASVEAQAHANAKERVVRAGVADTVLTHVYDIVQGGHWPDEYAGRALRNTFLGQWHGHESELSQAVEDQRRRVASALGTGDTELGVVYAGEASGLIHDILPAGDIVRALFADAEAVLGRRPGLLLDGND
jgi:nitronate monooxygenase